MRAVAWWLVVAMSGCSTTATVITRDGKRDETRVVGGDREVLLLQNDDGAEKVVRRADVKDIDHPGNVVATLGGLIASSYASALIVSGTFCGTSGASGGSSCTLLLGTSGGMTALGAGMLVWGLWAWLSSKNAVSESLSNPALPMPVTPLPPPTTISPPLPPPLPAL